MYLKMREIRMIEIKMKFLFLFLFYLYIVYIKLDPVVVFYVYTCVICFEKCKTRA